MARDPFPMRSDAAARLASSVDNNNNNNNNNNDEGWGVMLMTSGGQGPKDENVTEQEARKNLMTSKSKKVKGGAVDDDEQQHKYDDDGDDEQKEDEFLDRPLWESRSGGWFWRIAGNVYRRLYGDKLPVSEMLRTLCLASTLFFMIGGYWLLRSLKDPVLTALCGVSAIPKAKMLSVPVVLLVVSVYNHFLDSDIPKHQLFYIFGTFYFALFLAISLLLKHPTIGLDNQQPSPARLLGWISFCTIESFGSVMVSLFWSFANSNVNLETAKASYGVMVAIAQLGSVLGPTIAQRYAATIGVANCYTLAALCILLLQGTMRIYIRIYGASSQVASTAVPAKKEKAGILEGLHLFAKHNYVKGIFAMSCMFMVEVTIVDFTMKLLAKEYLGEEYPCEPGMSCYSADGKHGMSTEATEAFTSFMGTFGQATNSLSLFFSLFGTSAVIRHLGLRFTLLLFPTVCFIVINVLRIEPTLYVTFASLMTLKACSYALNNPTKEILYQPTSPAVRYKAKSWIDIFGSRCSKAVGSVITNLFSDSAQDLIANGSWISMALSLFLIWNARFMGQKFDEYTTTGFIVGGEDDEEQETQHMAVGQNEVDDTSCAIFEDAHVRPDEGLTNGTKNSGV